MTKADIFRAVGQACGVTVNELRGGSRIQRIADAKKICAALLKAHCCPYDEQVATALNSSRTWVPWAQQRHLDLMQVDKRYAKLYRGAEAVIGPAV